MNPTHNQLSPPPPVDITPADILRSAARYLELYGWIQGNYYLVRHYPWEAAAEPFPPACAWGAISMAVYGEATYCLPDTTEEERADGRLFYRVLDAFTDFIGSTDQPDCVNPDCRDVSHVGDTGSPYAWNDVPGRTAEQVTAALRAAADDYDRTHTTPSGGAR